MNGRLGAARPTFTIQDNDPPPAVGFSAGAGAASEGGRTFDVTVTLSAASGQAVSVDLSVVGGTATRNADYSVATPVRLTFAAGLTTKTVRVTILNDARDEPDETVRLKVAAPANATLGGLDEFTLTIQDDD